ncbi:bifunctional folylpolyglutamate synthase/dihydrofolate synthase [Flagellimonas sp. HMM57]|uniref:bifunctional folylpolyglutamate synthase/dihydrofolate synthase n=1 Tax=unclassified Flagellimonas TaxID=2644544 RepID=UPI0013D1A4A9|nr:MULTISPECIES: folylpolyglutamate synthase/dihydrofolate synthase family protein [unclassified Flagellimonas]UII74866.1 bifunctional folylpolyglutamate synthase/dihydrofolate synthase [Flagellimonas sp. HMM57]
MTYKETLSWMFQQLPMYQQKGAVAYKDKLDNILFFTELLGNPEKKFKSIHVAGTNGKGSSSHMLASVLQEAGYKVGLYTSPHLKDFRERIKINGKKVSEDYVKDFIKTHEPFLKENKLSFFEMTVGMAFSYFAEEKVDIAVVEVGLGGRLDSTNIIVPEVSLITNIGLDHIQILGDTLQKIALEKAGIIKKGVPVIISEKQPETEGIFKLIAAQKNAEITFAEEMDTKNYETDLLGSYQKKNSKGVVAVLKELKEFKIKEKHIRKGLRNVVENTGLLGRWQVLGEHPKTICDTAHNKEGLGLVLEQINKLEFSQVHFVLGFVNDKNLDTVLSLFPKNAKYYFVRPNIPRGLEAKALKAAAAKFYLEGETFKLVGKALEKAKKNAKPDDLVYVGGSTFVVAEVV